MTFDTRVLPKLPIVAGIAMSIAFIACVAIAFASLTARSGSTNEFEQRCAAMVASGQSTPASPVSALEQPIVVMLNGRVSCELTMQLGPAGAAVQMTKTPWRGTVTSLMGDARTAVWITHYTPKATNIAIQIGNNQQIDMPGDAYCDVTLIDLETGTIVGSGSQRFTAGMPGNDAGDSPLDAAMKFVRGLKSNELAAAR